MEFKGQYLTYQEFKALGGTLDEMPFNLLEYNARKKIDERTFGRLVDKGQEYKEVKLCIYIYFFSKPSQFFIRTSSCGFT